MNAQDNVDLLRVDNLSVTYSRRGSPGAIKAVRDVSFKVRKRKTMGLVGESGSGKTSAALAVMRVLEPASGTIHLGDVDLTGLAGRALRHQRHRFQMIFQDPASSLNPRLRARDILTEPMLLCGLGSKSQRLEKAAELLDKVGLPPDCLGLYPHQFSGGQRQRLVIARALSTSPELVVADEPVSALDAAIQAQILNLLSDLRANFGLTVLFISHDLGVVQHACHDVAVMRRGEIVEMASTEALFSCPSHPYTWALLSASIPGGPLKSVLKKAFGLAPEKSLRDKGTHQNGAHSNGVHYNGLNDNGGCLYSACPLREARCRQESPPLREIDPGHFSRCHLANQVRDLGGALLAGASENSRDRDQAHGHGHSPDFGQTFPGQPKSPGDLTVAA
ncbi:MAG: ABC transporter ATP-binding protein [Deltaproteobacteria bacterium]|nr:ABC transporter ATP-binding protein [Deltaproteobacteria bacterium]